VSYAVAAVARCEEGCPETGGAEQTFHNAAGALQYAGGAVALGLFAVGARPDPRWRALGRVAAALLVPYVTAVAAAPWMRDRRGAVQRVAEGILFGWITLLAGSVWAGSSPG
jgi:apolipoprotein N-acyltransferase